ncbi:transposase (plasmid) [Rhodococcus erythropolis R138]|nr:transposase [Rhodococcus erythropolis R138]
MRRFKSPGHAQRFLSAFRVIGSHFRQRRHLLSAGEYRRVMADQFAVWREATGSAVAAGKAPATRPLYHYASEHTVPPNIHVNVTSLSECIRGHISVDTQPLS